MDRPRLLFAAEAMGGGVFTYCHTLGNLLAQHFDLYLAYATRPQTPADFKTYFDPAIHLIPVESFCRSIRPDKDFAAARQLRRIVREIRPDIIHLHSSKAGAVGRLALLGCGKPVFYTPHGYSFLMEDASPVRRAFYFGLEYLLARTGAVTIACSPGEQEASFRLRRSKSLCVPNGLDIAGLEALVQPCTAPSRPFTVCTVGRICPQKNPEMFNETAKRLPDVPFVWVGDGEQRELLTAPNIRITGWLPREQALKQMMQASVLLLPSRWEGLPLTLLEGMYGRLCCIVSDAAGNRDVIRDGETGWICRTPEQYAQAIRRMQADPEAARNIGLAAHRSVMQQYTAEQMARRYCEIYTAALKNRKGEV